MHGRQWRFSALVVALLSVSCKSRGEHAGAVDAAAAVPVEGDPSANVDGPLAVVDATSPAVVDASLERYGLLGLFADAAFPDAGHDAEMPSRRAEVELQSLTVRGPQSEPDVRRDVRRGFPFFQLCYEVNAVTAPLRGEVTARFTIASDGSVTSAERVKTTVGESLATCVVGRLGKLSFSKVVGAPSNVELTLTFEPR